MSASDADDELLGFAYDNDEAALERAFKQGCSPCHANVIGQTALHIGAMWGNVGAVQVLLTALANPNAQNNEGSTPLHAAAMGEGPLNRRVQTVNLIIEWKGQPMLADHMGEVPLDYAADDALRVALGAEPLFLHRAAETRNMKELMAAVQKIKGGRSTLTIDTKSPTGQTALHRMVEVGWHQGVEVLVLSRADVCVQDYLLSTPLHKAVLSGKNRTVHLLLRYKADVNAKDSDLDHDPKFESKSLTETPYEHRTPLHYAAQLGNVIAVRQLLALKASPNARDSKQFTPLHLCLGLRSSEVVLETGSGVRTSGLQKKPEWNNRLGSVIGQQVKKDSETVRWPVELLLDGDDHPPVLLKEDNMRMLSEETLDCLLSARADVNLGNNATGDTHTMLHQAAHTSDIALAKKVLEAGASLDQQDQNLGLSALHLAARKKNHAMVELLVGAKANIEQLSSTGKTAADIARVNCACAATMKLLGGPTAEEEEKTSLLHLGSTPCSMTNLYID